MPDISDGGALAALTALMGDGGALTTVNLFKSRVVPTPESTPASFVPSDFDGYAPLTSNQWVFSVNSGGVVTAVSPWFQLTKGPDPTKGQSIYGLYVSAFGVKARTPQYIDGKTFDPPVPMGKKGQTLRFKVILYAAVAAETGGTGFLSAVEVVASYETYRARGLFRRRLKALAKRIQALIADEAKRAEAADYNPDVPFNSVWVDPGADDAAGIILARCQDILSR